jgi:hypothetical protein
MAVNIALVFVIAVLGSKDGIAEGACKVVDVILSVQSCYVRAAKRTAALMTEQAESPKIVGLAKRVLALAVVVVCREEFGSYYLAAILN